LNDNLFCIDIYGEGPLKDDIINCINNYNLTDKVVLKGFNTNKFEIFSKSDILIFSSESEGFGRVPFEALFFGNMVICNKKVSIIDEFLNLPILWTQYDDEIILKDYIMQLSKLDIESSLRLVNKISTSLSSKTHCDNFIDIMNKCIND
jgi:hypothetical protein